MHSDTVTIYCPNHFCQAPNLENQRFCQQCRTFLPKRYLWAIGKGMESLRSGELLAERYSVKQSRVVLDTKPGLLPASPEISSDLEPYLRLVLYQLHVPQVYGLVESPQKQRGGIVLLEQVPIYVGAMSASLGSLEGQLMPELMTVWQQSTALRQLHWLWQIAHLWEPFAAEGVAASLLQPDLLRVEGALVRLLSLQPDGRTPPTLAALGQLWQRWQPTAQPEVAAFLGQLCQLLQQGMVRNAEQLVLLLDRALADRGRSQSRHLHIATLSDQGPSRQRNEDACYPPSGTIWTGIDPAQTQPLVVVCDGIGGHEGGNVASNLAIDTVQQQLQSLPPHGTTEPTVLMLQLEQVALSANDVISQRNDSEQRQERQRMGTTLVLALAHDHELYLTHVGDSRIYRITRLGCHQVTLDDDLASREVRLGYALYREALQQPGSGSLVQALGMNASTLLHPTVQRFVLDEDCVFLLCSDGLSDHDRVDEYWQSELLPLLEGKVDVATASQQLLTIANRVNGHDNVTIGLLHCQVSPSETSGSLLPLTVAMDVPHSGAQTSAQVGAKMTEGTGSGFSPDHTQTKTQILPTRKAATNPFLVGLSLLVMLGLGGVFAYAAFPGLRLWADSLASRSRPLPESIVPTPASSPLESPLANAEALSVGALIRVQNATVEATTVTATPLSLWSQPEQPTLSNTARLRLGSLPPGSVLQISSRQAVPDRGYWLKLKVCSMPVPAVPAPAKTNTSTPAVATLQPGESGWIEQDAIAPLVTQNLGLKASQLGACATVPTPTASPLPTTSPLPVKPTK